MSLRVVLARHGESVWHADNRYAGVSDIELTQRGHDQADALAGWAATAGLDGVWSSPQRRARDTAEPAAKVNGLPVEVDARLRELDFGVAEGLTRSEMSSRFPEDLDAFRVDPVTHHFPGGEHPRGAAERYLDVLGELRQRHPEGKVLVVAHSTAIRLALCALLGMPLNRYRTVFPLLVNCALTEVVLDRDVAAILSLNVPVLPTTGASS